MVELFGFVFALVVAVLCGYYLGNRNAKTTQQGTADNNEQGQGNERQSNTTRTNKSPKVKPQHVSPLLEVAAEQERIGGIGSPDPMLRRMRNEELALGGEDNITPRLILCSWRLPVSIKKIEVEGDGDPEWDIKWHDARDVITNMRCLQEDMEIFWIGYPGWDVPDEEQESLEAALEEFNCTPLFLEQSLVDRFYHGYCKGVLWQLFHYLMPTNDQAFSKTYTDLWQAYSAVNMIMAKKAHLLSEGNAMVWVHNYHLMLVPMFLRKQNPHVSCGWFCHTTWPTSAVFRTLPSRTSIVRGLLAADLIGFHTYDYARHFRSSIKRLLHLDFHTREGGIIGIAYNGRDITLRISHVSVRSQELTNIVQGDPCQAEAARIKAQHRGRQIIIGVDDLDITKGTMLKMQAYAHFLKNHPEWRKRVTFVYILTQGSNKLNSKRYEMKTQVEAEISSIRKEFGDEVIHMVEHAPSINDLCAIYAAADIALFSSFWDGFAMAPYEYTVAQGRLENPGCLIVSEFMGCSRSLSGVIRVNPWQLSEVSKAIQGLLSSSPEARAANHKKRYNYVMSYTFKSWAEGFLKDLARVSESNYGKDMVHLGWGSKVNLIFLPKNFAYLGDPVQARKVEIAFKRAKHRIILYDYGGTLTEGSIYTTALGLSSGFHGKDRVSKLTLKHLSTLAKAPNNTVFIVTGQSRRVLERHFGRVHRIGLAAEKGAFYKWTDAEEWERVELGNLGWRRIVLQVMNEFTSRTTGSYVSEKEASLVWHFEDADIEFGEFQASEMERYLMRVINVFEIEITKYDHTRILEVRSSAVSKGIVCTRVLENVLSDLSVADRQSTFLMCCGNDRSDEKMYKAMHAAQAKYNLKQSNVYTVSVGIQPSAAHYFYKTQGEVLDNLENMSGHQFRQSVMKTNALAQHSSQNSQSLSPIQMQRNGITAVAPDYDMSFCKINEAEGNGESNDEYSSSDNSERDRRVSDRRRGRSTGFHSARGRSLSPSLDGFTNNSSRDDSSRKRLSPEKPAGIGMKKVASAPSLQQVFPDGMRLRRRVKMRDVTE